MTYKRFPTLRTQWLGRKMRQLRLNAGETLATAGGFLGRDQATLSRMENGISLMRVIDIVALLDFYGVVDPDIRMNVEQISRDAWQRGWWDGFSKNAPLWMLDLAWMERRATSINSFDTLAFHGTLQSEAYARALITAADPDASQSQLDRWLQLRLNRGQVLSGVMFTRCEPVIDEAVFSRNFGGPDVMRHQLRHLLYLQGSKAVQFRILPNDLDAHPAPDGSFSVLKLPHPYPHVGHIDTAAGNLWVEGEAADSLASRYAALKSAALPPEKSVAKVRDLLKELE